MRESKKEALEEDENVDLRGYQLEISLNISLSLSKLFVCMVDGKKVVCCPKS